MEVSLQNLHNMEYQRPYGCLCVTDGRTDEGRTDGLSEDNTFRFLRAEGKNYSNV